MRLHLFALTLVASALFAQSDRGLITGTVSDPAGAVVANAPIEARNAETGVNYQVASSATGNYTLPQLPVGNYEVTVTVPGFKRYVRQGLAVGVAQTLRVDVALEVGAATESVTVTEAAPLLKTESGELSHNVASKNLNELPILGIGGTQAGSAGIRNPFAVVQLMPGTTWVPNSNVRVNGAPSNTQSFRIEGQDASNTGTPGVPAQTQPSVDAIQEMAIQTSNFAAEFGQVGGGVFNVTMKSGTNQIHGTVYNYFVNEIFNAGQPFTNLSQFDNPRPRARRNNYGFTVGGPVWIPKLYNGRDKTFFFVNWEEFRESTVVNSQFQTIPTLAYRAGDFRNSIIQRDLGIDPVTSQQMREGMIFDPASTRTLGAQTVRDQFPNNTIPVSRFDPVAVRIQNLMPLPAGPTPNGLVNNFLNPYASTRVTHVPSVKLDQAFGSSGRLSFFWQETETRNPNGNTIFGQSDGLPEPLTTALGTFQNAPLYRLNYDHTLRPTLLLHFGAGYRSNYFLTPPVTPDGQVRDINVETTLGLKGAIINQFFPGMSGLLAGNGAGGIKNIGQVGYSRNITQNPSFNTYLNWVKGNHTYKFGGELRIEGYPPQSRANTQGSYVFSTAETAQPFQNVPVNGGNTGFGYASFLLGLVNQVSIAQPTAPRLGKHQLGLYAQDTWKVRRQFTVDYGVRYDYSTYLREQYGRVPKLDMNVIHPRLGIPGAAVFDGTGPGRCNCDFASNYPYAIAPRLGAAYQLNPKTVFRMGFGIVYSGTAVNNNAAGGLVGSTATTVPANFSTPVTTLSTGIPVSFRPAQWPVVDAGFFPTAGVVPGPGPAYLDQNAGRPARQYQWSIGVQRELSRDLVVEATYVANRGVWWQAPGLINVNSISPARIAALGLNLDSADDRTLLTSRLNTAVAAQRGFNRQPYAGFPVTQFVGQALRPFPQFTTITNYWNPGGKTWYDSVQIKATKRLSHGLSFLSTFTWQKSLALGSEIGEPNPGTTGGAVFNDVFNRAQNKYISAYDQPFAFNISATYLTPKIAAAPRLLAWAAADWSFGVFLQYASGMPLQVPYAQSALSSYLFNGIQGTPASTGTFANRVPGQPLFTQDLNCHCYDPNSSFVLNPAAWTDPALGQFGTSAAYYSDYRKQRRPVENVNLGRTFRLGERVTFNMRMELTNVFNRAFWADPLNTNAKALQQRLVNGNTTAGFGKLVTTTQLSTANLLPRSGVVVARITF